MKRASFALDGQWRFRIDRDEKGQDWGYHTSGYQPLGWLEVPVPGSWDTYLPELFGYAGHGWYRRTFRPDAAWQGARIHLRFEGANYQTTVWLDGRLVGVHNGGFDPFEFDVTDALNWEGENALAVRVDNWPCIRRVPNSLGGWWNYGGIYRSVKLLALPAVRIADVTVHAEPGEGPTSPLSIEAAVINEGPETAVTSLSAEVTFGGQPAALRDELAAPPVTLEPGGRAHLSLASGIEGARLWSPGEPNLYTLHLALQEGQKAVDALDVTFGVRSFEVGGTQLLLNGEPVFLTGFNRHEEYHGTGRVDPGGQLEADLRLIKEMNGNTVRMHYQAHPDLYDLCDRLGLLVWAEIPVWQVGNKDLGEFSHPVVQQTAEQMLGTLVDSLKNHPSVVIWSVGNECATNREEARPFIRRLVTLVRSLDGTRPVAYVGMYDTEEKVFDLVDLPAVNKYLGWDTDEFIARIEGIHALHPGKPLLVTEFGHEAVLGLRGEGYGTEDDQALVLQSKFEGLRERRDYVGAALIWCLADYWHMPAGPDFRWLNRTYFCHGVTDLKRRPKVAASVVKRMFGRG